MIACSTGDPVFDTTPITISADRLSQTSLPCVVTDLGNYKKQIRFKTLIIYSLKHSVCHPPLDQLTQQTTISVGWKNLLPAIQTMKWKPCFNNLGQTLMTTNTF
ncbi:hypothetical protein KUTeg_018464 [Tegillarca granosa]|uniref:Uncharacterized protein n=1 Tax=Tegillarca granosa TaxID=220873 RepID=A0ABQ9EI03_TEGGR|nr:hypothetical protein KUTeg_018464 [Tegillarca granosa]